MALVGATRDEVVRQDSRERDAHVVAVGEWVVAT
jgi:hypothetical protein